MRNKDLISKHVFAGNTRLVSKVVMNEEKSGKMVATEQGSYYYHADHLGSSSVVTDGSGKFYEQIEYFPYGETWVHNKASSTQTSTPYKFTSKEQDEETGLYYYGARYYDARLSRWISADPPMSRGEYFPKPKDFDTDHDYQWDATHNEDEKLPGMGGVFNPINLDTYHYAGNNPVKLVDPDGDAAVLGAVFGLAGGVATEVAMQATANIVAGKGAFEDLDYSDIVVSGLLGGAAGASGLGAVKQGKDAYNAYKTYKVANASLKARNAAIAAGKIRNVEKTAKVANKVNESKKAIIKAASKGGAVAAAKKVVQKTVNKVQDENNNKNSDKKR